MSTPLPTSLQAEMADLLGSAWLTDDSERLGYAYDNSRQLALPDAVALPTSAAQVVALVRACRKHRVPVVARGRGTNTTGGSTGYDLQRLLVGSEGTLALIVEASLRLTPAPTARRALRAFDPDAILNPGKLLPP